MKLTIKGATFSIAVAWPPVKGPDELFLENEAELIKHLLQLNPRMTLNEVKALTEAAGF